MKVLRHTLGVFIISLVLVACSSVSVFNEYAYRDAVAVKVEALQLMEKGTEEYTLYQKEAEQVIVKAKKAYEYEKGRANNEITTKMWEIMISPERNLLGGYLKRWKEKGKMGEEFVKQSGIQVAEAFDYIIGFESKKIKKDKIPSSLLN